MTGPASSRALTDFVAAVVRMLGWFWSAYEASPVGMAVCNGDDRIVTANAAFARFVGRPIGDLVGAEFESLLGDALPGDRRSPFQSTERRFVHGDGTEVWGRLTRTPLRDDADPAMTFVQVDDITDQRHSQDRLEFEANHDELTGLVNRRTLLTRLGEALGASAGPCGLLLIDVDRFKAVNDAMGHPSGDVLLAAVAQRIRTAVRGDDVVCRLGGDEFAVLLRSAATAQTAVAAADRLLEAMAAPIAVGDSELHTSVSVGISMSRSDTTIDSILREADAALYRAKAAGRNRWVRFDDDMRASLEARSRLEGELRIAVDGHALMLHYQPLVSLLDGSVVGVEALVRWPHHVMGLLGADTFVELAEEVGLIDELGRWVLAEACQALARWSAHPHLTMAVNVSAIQLTRTVLVDDIAEAIETAGIDPSRIIIEVTETAVMRDLDRSMRTLVALSELGVGLAIDDFGTGFSSLAHLKWLPVDTLKIDRSFVDDLDVDVDSRAIAATIMRLADSLGLSVIAEGVTTEAQRDLLVAMGCRQAQGHLWSRALSEAALLELLDGSVPAKTGDPA
jgi:diguanylate cyclase (GGDEF)-like protein/PAS domain S-box-containing protein